MWKKLCNFAPQNKLGLADSLAGRVFNSKQQKLKNKNLKK